jgi:DNA invertase Pin-like site-specific DNA recombinase
LSEGEGKSTGKGAKLAAPVHAAEYVRMSTEHQQYSTENQAEVIRHYASQRGIEIIRTYADEGKSGLNLEGRDALKRLIKDVQSGSAGFTTILVYDVSRWGRFQDTDEPAYYEQICKLAGISVQYCAEPFENDGSLVATILKSVKRAMAGEYSRELSVKVFRGQSHLIELGFRQGGPAGYGIRRQLIDQSGNPKCLLAQGEHKSLQTDRVILVPGPEHEVQSVRWIYKSFVQDGVSERKIAALLNERGIHTDLDRPWSRGTVHQVLINEKYIGNNVWNRRSFKLKQKRVQNDPDTWIRKEDAFEPIVQRDLFNAAQALIAARSQRLSDNEMLDTLRRLLAEHDYLSGLIIDEADGVPSSSAYRTRFGSLLRAYSLIGYTPSRDYCYIEVNRLLRRLHPRIVADTIAGIKRVGASVYRDPQTDMLAINAEFTASIVIARYGATAAGTSRWHVRLDTGLCPDITVAVRMNEFNSGPLDYYLLPWITMNFPRLRLARDNGIEIDAFRFDTLEPMFDLTARTSILKVA